MQRSFGVEFRLATHQNQNPCSAPSLCVTGCVSCPDCGIPCSKLVCGARVEDNLASFVQKTHISTRKLSFEGKPSFKTASKAAMPFS